MKDSIEMPKSMFYIIVSICSAIIMLTSIDMLLRTKDVGLFNMWLSNTNFNDTFLMQTKEELFSEYIQMNVSLFLVRVITPIGLGIHTYFTLTKLRVNKLYVMLWTLITIGAFIVTTIGEQYYSIFFILSGVGYLGIIIVMISLGKSLNSIKCI